MTQLKTINDTESELVITVTVSDEENQKEYNTELSGISKTAKLDGFRQGKVPISVVKKKYDGQCQKNLLVT